MPNEFDNLAAHGLQTTTKGEEGKMQTEKLFCKQYVEENPARRRHLKPRCESCKKALKFVQRNNKTTGHAEAEAAPVLPSLAHESCTDKALIDSKDVEALADRNQKLRKTNRALKEKVKRRDETIRKWREHFKKNFRARGVKVSKGVSADVRDIMSALSEDLSDERRVQDIRKLLTQTLSGIEELASYDDINSVTTDLLTLFRDQINLHAATVSGKKTGRRYSPQLINLAMNIYSRSPKAMDCMGQHFQLPSKRTILRYKERSFINSGSNSYITENARY